MKVLFIVPYPLEGASSRVRVYQYIPLLEREGIECNVSSFLSSESYETIHTQRNLFSASQSFIEGVLKRARDLIIAKKYDVVFIQKEAFPLFRPIFEQLFQKICAKIIFDFDDAIFLPQKFHGKIRKFLKCPEKLPEIIKLSRRVIAGNNYLKDYAMQYNSAVEVIPSSIDTEKYLISEKTNNELITIGWMGSFSTLPFLKPLEKVFHHLARQYNISFCIVSDKQTYRIENVKVIHRRWNLNREVQDLQGFDIGIMPLPKEEWSLGKCGYKALQYMAVGIPVVCSPVGVNKEIIIDGVNGFLADSMEEWVEKLSRLIENFSLRTEIGKQGRQTIEKKFSLQVNTPKLISLIKTVDREEY